MALTQLSEYDLLAGILEKGLSFVGSYLEFALGKTVLITDSQDQLLYPEDLPPLSLSPGDTVSTATGFSDNPYYNESDKTVYCRIGNQIPHGMLIIAPVQEPEASGVLAFIQPDAIKAIDLYFLRMDKRKIQQEKQEKELAENLVYRSNANIRDILNLYQVHLEIDKPYYVSIVQPDPSGRPVNLKEVRSYSSDYWKSRQPAVASLVWEDCVVAIVPVPSDSPAAPSQECHDRDSAHWKKAVDERFRIPFSAGLGQTYTLLNLHKSYNEARIALAIPRLMGQKTFVQPFSDLGVFSMVFSQDIQSVIRYCQDYLAPLIDYDEKTESVLLPTLKKLFDNNFNWKPTADSLFVHINTLHYRVNKIEALLGLDLSHMDTRSNLFIAVKAWDALQITGFLD